jgi:hypothetical protein
MTNFREHGVPIYLDRELYVAFIKLQADRGLGRAYAGLLPFVEGLYQMGYISKEVYEVHRQKYSEPLLDSKASPKVVDTQVEQLNKTLGMVYEQWNDHPKREWREKWLKTARQHAELSNAKLILALEQKVVSNE